MSLLLSGPTLTEEDLGIKDGIDDESLSCRHPRVGDSLFERTFMEEGN